MKETYWDIFTHSGSVQDYLAFCKDRQELQNAVQEVQPYDLQNAGIDSQGTERG